MKTNYLFNFSLALRFVRLSLLPFTAAIAFATWEILDDDGEYYNGTFTWSSYAYGVGYSDHADLLSYTLKNSGPDMAVDMYTLIDADGSYIYNDHDCTSCSGDVMEVSPHSAEGHLWGVAHTELAGGTSWGNAFGGDI